MDGSFFIRVIQSKFIKNKRKYAVQHCGARQRLECCSQDGYNRGSPKQAAFQLFFIFGELLLFRTAEEQSFLLEVE